MWLILSRASANQVRRDEDTVGATCSACAAVSRSVKFTARRADKVGLRDFAVLLFLLAAIAAAIRTPWHGVLALAIFSYLNPHRYAYGFMYDFPTYQILFLVVAASFFYQGWKTRQPLPKDWRIPAFFILWLHFFITTIDAAIPDLAWQRFWENSKIYIPLVFTLWMIDNRKKLYYLLIAIAGSIALVGIKGGIWAIGTGFAHRVWGPPRTQYYDNNAIAILLLMGIPLVILWLRETTDRRLRYALLAAVPLMFAAAVSTHSRGGLVTIAVILPVLLWHSKRKWMIWPVIAVGLWWLVQNLPEHWFARMETIQTYEEDVSAMRRIEAWTDGINYALRNPLTGAGADGYYAVTKRDWHNSYVEMLAENGFPGFILWMALLFGTMWSLTRLPRKTRHIPEMKWVSNYSYMLRASLIAYSAGTMFMGLSYWSALYHLIFIAVLVRKFALAELAEHEARRKAEQAARPRFGPGRLQPTYSR